MSDTLRVRWFRHVRSDPLADDVDVMDAIAAAVTTSADAAVSVEADGGSGPCLAVGVADAVPYRSEYLDTPNLGGLVVQVWESEGHEDVSAGVGPVDGILAEVAESLRFRDGIHHRLLLTAESRIGDDRRLRGVWFYDPD